MSIDRTLLGELTKLASDRIASISNGIMQGNLTEGEYKQQCGHVAGIRETLELAGRIYEDIRQGS